MTTTLRLPTPNSWYALAFSSELKPGTVLTRRLAGQDLVVYRTRSGKANVTGAYCPHLGAHLGHGGTVVGEEIRCPFHAFRFDLDGRCTATGYGTKPPPTARLNVWPVREANGIVFVWYDSRGLPPAWTPPALDMRGWTRMHRRAFTLRDHPQETVENGVDIGHFAIVHGYSDVQVEQDICIDGPVFRTAYAATRPMPGLGRLGAKVRFHFELAAYGLGYSLVHVRVPRFGVRSRLFILATPTEPDRITLHLALSLRKVNPGKQYHPLLGIVPGGLLSNLIARAVHASLVHDANQDFVIWENKRYVHPPALAQGDGPIGKFRTWARQFYHEQPVVIEA
ncbi:MAG TPA: Rieske 2Fe-2S domain-containing protein [Chloroflexia bacterium]|nr:Rieske 2Fe-2S domain-containing protein [Chloroflexia bacterium]